MAKTLKTDDMAGSRYICKVLVSKYRECGKTYATALNLRKHIASKHGGKTQ